ncbi:hypothetical protein Tco_0033749 [Tanacetum coccineum]
MDDQNITMEEYIRLKEEKARRQGRTFDWQTATYGRMEYYENEDDNFTNLETEYPTIVFDDISDEALSCKPTVSPLDNNEIDFNILFDESDDEEYMIVFDENSFSCKIISVDNLKTNSENENDKINIPSSPSPEPTIGYFDDLDFFKDFENEFPTIVYNDLKSKSDPLNGPYVGCELCKGPNYTKDCPLKEKDLFCENQKKDRERKKKVEKDKEKIKEEAYLHTIWSTGGSIGAVRARISYQTQQQKNSCYLIEEEGIGGSSMTKSHG